MNTSRPDPAVPIIGCDFNACGWSGQDDDNCYYVLDLAAIARLPQPDGARVFVFDWKDLEEPEVVGCEATLEWVDWTELGCPRGWRAWPDEATWYSGPIFWQR